MKKILLIRFSSIGDVVLTTPVLRCLKKQTGAEIHYLIKSAFAPLLEANPYVDRLIPISKNVSEALPLLKPERYDCVVDLHKNWRSLRVRMALGAQTFSFDKLNFEKWLLVNFNINCLPGLHVVERYFGAVAPLGVVNDGAGLDYCFPENVDWSNLEDLTNLRPYFAFAIGAAHQTKRLPVEKIVAICKGAGRPVVLLGGKAEAAEGDEISRQVTESRVVNFCGKLSLHESAAVLRDAALVLTHDTGMMHIAAAFHKRILSVWGSTVPAFGMTPYFGNSCDGSGVIFEVKNLTCRPCSKIGFRQCPKGHFRCMNDIGVEEILATLNS